MATLFMTAVGLYLFTVSSFASPLATDQKRRFPAPLRLYHGPNKELILERDVEPHDEEEEKLSKRGCKCRCRRKGPRNDPWECCPCAWTDEVCFPGDTVLRQLDGTEIQMKSLKAGTRIKTVSDDGHVIYSEVKTFLKRQPTKSALYLTIFTSTGQNLTLSGRHLVFVSSSNNTADMESRFALSVKEGDYLFTTSGCGQSLCPSVVTHIEPVVKEGVYVPLTEEGTLLVNDVFASCYSSINHHIAHAFTAPFRWFPWLLSPWQDDGYSPIVDWMKQVGHVILPNHLQFQDQEISVLPQVRIEL